VVVETFPNRNVVILQITDRLWYQLQGMYTIVDDADWPLKLISTSVSVFTKS